MVTKLSRLINNILNEEFEKSTKHLILKDFTKISLDYVPDSLAHRETELSRLAYLFRDLLASFNLTTFEALAVLILGDNKSGKTATLKRFGGDFEKFIHGKKFTSKIHFSYRHINCIRYRTIYSIFISVIQSYVPEFPIRGFSTFELLKYLKEYLEVSNSYLLLTLDDVDALIADKDYETVLISLVTNEIESFAIYKQRISIILVSNNEKYLESINPFVSNQLKQNVLIFQRYSLSQLFDILKLRASETLYPNSWTDEDIKTIVDLVQVQNSGHSDPRLGLEILWRSARDAEQQGFSKINIKKYDLTETLAFSNSNIELNLKIQEKVILFIISDIFLKNPHQSFTKIKEIKKEFDKKKLQLNIPFSTLGYTSIFNYLQELKRLNLIVTQVTNGQKRGRSTIIKLNIVPSHVQVLLKNELLKDQLSD